MLKKIKDKYLIRFPYSYNNDGFEVNSRLIRAERDEQVWIEEQPTSIIERRKLSRAVSYGSLTPEQYEKRRTELLTDSYEDDYGNTKFKSLDDEFAYKKFIEDHKPEYEEYIDNIAYDINVIEITGRVDNPYITPYRFIGGKDVNDSLYRYLPDPYALAKEVAKKYGFEEVEDKTWNKNTTGLKWSVPNHSKKSLRFIKINGDYEDSNLSLPKRHSEPQFNAVTAGSWGECDKMYKQHYNAVDALFKQAKAKYDKQGKNIDVAQVVKKLEHFESLVRRIDSKARSEVKTFYVTGQINDFKNELLNGGQTQN